MGVESASRAWKFLSLNSEQKQRWAGTALLEIEPQLRLVRGMRHLPALRAALQRENVNHEASGCGLTWEPSYFNDEWH